MAYTTPKTDWNESYVPSPSDMNRIEGNVEDNRAEIVVEETARIAGDNNLAADLLLEESARIAADGVLDTALGVETAARIAADATKVNNANLGSRTYSSGTIGPAGTYTIPSGVYYCAGEGSIALEVFSTSGWADISGNFQRYSGMVISDGTNVRLRNTDINNNQTWKLVKIS